MSRYDQYSPSALEILHTVQDIVRREGRAETTLPDLARAVLLAAVPDILGIARHNHRALNRERLKALHESIFKLPAPGSTGAIRLSREFRSVLDQAEKLSSGEIVRPEHIIHAAWAAIKDDIEPYISGEDESEPVRQKIAATLKGSNKGIIDPEASVFGAQAKPESIAEGIESPPGIPLNEEELSRRLEELLSEDGFPDTEPRTAPARTGGSEGARGDIVLPEIKVSPEREMSIDFLSTIGRELTAPGKRYEVLGREAEIDALVTVLLRKYKPNPLVIGESGVGKTALVEGLAQRVLDGKVPPPLRGVRIFEVRLSELAAGTAAHGAMEERLRALVQAAETCPDVIIFLDEMHQAAQAYGNEPTADVLKPALSRGTFRCIGAATVAEYHRHLERDEAFLRRFQVILLKEPDPASTRIIMDGVASRLSRHFDIGISPEMVGRCIDAVSRHLPARFFPDKAIDAMDRACAACFARGKGELDEGSISEAVASMANAGRASGEWEVGGIEGLEERIRRDIVGQDQAIDQVCTVVRVCKKRLDLRPERPDGAFLFTGPTGVGKTALAESLARRLTGRDDALFRVDMSEFSEPHTVARLLGAPPGYIGYGDIAILGSAVEKNPAGVLLLDEFEKAHPQVHRLFLQILDSGRATDAYGKVLSFSDMTIIATCNINDDSGARIGFSEGTEGPTPLPLARLKQVFPPELLNRFDALVPFNPLSRQQCASILRDILVEKSNANLRKDYGFELILDGRVEELILDQGFSREFGARNLQRAYESILILPLSKQVDALRGARRVAVSMEEGGKLNFRNMDEALP